MTTQIQLISGPRNISTALMYSFGNRKDTAVIDEPFYAHYLQLTGIDHPGRHETLRSMPTDIKDILKDLFDEKGVDYFFIKNMAHHMIGFDISYSFKIRNLFLIRDPKKLISSFSKVINNPDASDIGLERELELFRLIKENGRYDPVVMDTGELLKNPEKVLKEVCDKLEIPFDYSMLSWDAGPRPEDGVWARYWYKSVHRSTHFEKQKSTATTLEERLVPLYEEVLPFYEELYDKAIKA